MFKRPLNISIILLSVLLILNLLFPPYQIETGRKFFDFLFFNEYRYFYTGKDITYTITGRNLNKKDSAYAINIIAEKFSDTIYSYKQIKEFPKFNPSVNKNKKGLYSLESLDYKSFIIELIKNKPKEYYSKSIDTIINRTRFIITKPKYIQTYRQLVVYQLIFQIIISFLVCMIFYLIIKSTSLRGDSS